MTHMRAYQLWICALLVYVYQFVLRVSPGVMVDELMESLRGTAVDVGRMASIYMLTFGMFHIIAGMLLDRWPLKRILMGSLFFLVIACFLFADAHDFYDAYMARALMGLGSTSLFPLCAILIKRFFPESQNSFMLALTVTIGVSGAFYGGGPLVLCVQSYGIKVCFIGLGVLGMMIGLCVWAGFRKSNRQTTPHDTIDLADFKKRVLFLWRLPQVRYVGLACAGLYLPVVILGDLWGPSYLTRLCECSLRDASWIASLVYVGTCIGGPLGAFLSKYYSYKRIMLSSVIFMIILILSFIIFNSLNFYVAACLIFLLGVFSGSEVLGFSWLIESMSSKMTGLILGIVCSYITFSGACLQFFFGLCLDGLWDGTLSDGGARFYRLQHYQWALGALLLTTFIALWALLRTQHKNEAFQ